MLESVKPIQSETLISLSFLRARIPAEFQGQFCEDSRTCLDCGGHIVEKDDEVVCSSCGRIWNDLIKVETEGIPFVSSDVERGHAESHFSPPSELAFGRAMGGVLDGKALFKILAKGPSGNTDLPLRACFIKILTSKTDHPTVQSLLSYGSELCYRFGFKSNNDSDQVFSNQLGRLLRKIGAYYILRNDNQGELRRVANAIFYVQFVALHPQEAKRVFNELGLSKELIHHVQTLLSVLECPRVPKKTKRKLSGSDGKNASPMVFRQTVAPQAR